MGHLVHRLLIKIEVIRRWPGKSKSGRKFFVFQRNSCYHGADERIRLSRMHKGPQRRGPEVTARNPRWAWLRPTPLCKLGAAFVVLLYILLIVGTLGQPQASRPLTMAVDRFPESDFLCFYAASSLGWSGTPEAVYDNRLRTEEASLARGKDFSTRPFWYPPTFLLMVLPLALIPFLASLALWVLVTLGGFLLILKRICLHPLTIWVALAFPATFQNSVRGQNGFLSAIFLGGGLLLLERSPFVGGLMLGLMSYKPSLAPLIPVALLAGRHWRALGGAFTSAAAMALVSLVVFGPDIWSVYFGQLLAIGASLTPNFCLEYNTTLYALAGCFGAGARSAKILQWLVMGLLVLVVAWAWSRKGSLASQSSILILGILLFSPYVLVYDLTLLALPIAWLASQAMVRGWLPGELPMVTLGWISPFFSTFLVFMVKVPIAPIIVVSLLLLTIRRLSLEAEPDPISP
jgi:alpha-1,2-mannosyltransferase